jgi:cell division protein FtsB
LRWLFAALLLLLLALQYRLWIAQGSLAEQRRLELQVEEICLPALHRFSAW